MNIKFSIIGNQENQKGNPIPYHRATQGSKWNAAHQRYCAWKDYVRASFDKSKDIPSDAMGKQMVHTKMSEGPLGRVSAVIMFGKETHADPDNIVKGILDSLFENDKHIDVETWHVCGNAEPRVEVTMEIL